MASPVGLDLFVLLVEYVFGSIILSIIGWAVVIFVTGILGRVSIESSIVILITYLAIAAVGYIGALAAVILFIFSAWYMVTGILRAVNGTGI